MPEVSGKWVCFNCRDERRTMNGTTYPKRTLEIIKPSQFNKKKKGKVIRKAVVCEACYSEGHNKVPVGFNGFLPVRKIDPKILEVVKQQREKAMKELEGQEVKPLYPQSSSPAVSTEHGHEYKPQEK